MIHYPLVEDVIVRLSEFRVFHELKVCKLSEFAISKNVLKRSSLKSLENFRKVLEDCCVLLLDGLFHIHVFHVL